MEDLICLLATVRTLKKEKQNKTKTKNKTKKKKKPEIVFNKSKRIIVAFQKAFSWETNLWVTLSDFTIKKTQNWEGKSVLNWKSTKLKRHLLCCR